MTDAPAAATQDRLFLARQPILDANETLIGYELLFRDSADNRAPAAGPGMATASVVCKAFAELGLAGALEGYKAFIIADAEFLRHEAIDALPPERIVFELDAGLAGDAQLVARCLELARRGYALCLTGLADPGAVPAALLGQSMFVKLNVRDADRAALQRLLALPADVRPILIASHVETHEDRQRALELGFRYFQGYYFAKPTLVQGRKIDTSTQALIRIVNLINRDADAKEIEQAFKGEAPLTLKLLRLTNSVGMGLRVRISSVQQAVNIVGRRQLQRWLQLLLFSRQGGNGDVARNPLMQLAALKGSFMERLARLLAPRQSGLSDQAFLAGMMSLMPAALGVPMIEILEQIAVVPQLRQALLERQGELGALLDLADSYDNDDPAGAERALARLEGRIGRDALHQCLAEAIAWAQSLGVEAN